jgi:hypothetical protein
MRPASRPLAPVAAVSLPGHAAYDGDTGQRQQGQEHGSGKRRGDKRNRTRFERHLAYRCRERRPSGRTHGLTRTPTLLCGEQRAVERAD